MNVMELGGSESLILNIIRNLDRSHWNPSVGWFNKKDPLPEFVELGIPLFHFPKLKRLDLKTMNMIASVIKDNDIQVVNAHHYLSLLYAFYGSKIANKSILVYTEHSEAEVCNITGKLRIIGHILARYSDAIIGVTDSIRNRLIDKYWINNSKVYSVKNGVDLNIFSSNDVGIYERNNIGLKEKDIAIGIVANLKYNKNHIYLLRAFSRLVTTYTNLKLIIVGKSFQNDIESSEKDIIDYIKNHSLKDNVYLMGFRSDVNRILQLIDIFCLVSYKEGLPISLIEAMAVGLPVIGADSVGIRDVISNGENGFLVKIDDVEDLKNKLAYLIENPNIRSQYGKNGREEVIRQYDIKKCVLSYETIFMSCLKRNSISI